MTAPRFLLPGQTYLITRRTSQRCFRLRPSADVNQIILYCFAYACEQTSVSVHALLAMSNHIHLVISDPKAELPVFMHRANLLIAKAMNSKDGCWENYFSPGSYSAVRLGTPEDVLDKIAYTYVNPVRAALVRSASSWPGVTTIDQPVNEPLYVERPDFFFSKRGRMPSRVALRIEKPPSFDDMTDQDFRSAVMRAVEGKQEQARAANAERGRAYLGKKKCKKVRPADRPKARGLRRRLNPRVASRVTSVRLRLLDQLAQFRTQYRLAMKSYHLGDHDCEFPAGTYWMRVFMQVPCRAPT